MNNRQVEEYLRRLNRRKDFLQNRVDSREEENSHYDKAELTALTWIIKYVEDTMSEASDHYFKNFQDKEYYDQV